MAPTEDASAGRTQIPVPSSLTSSTTSLPPLTSHLLVSHLRQTGSLADLSVLLTDSLARTGWTDRVRALALELLRNGTCDTFPDLLEEVLRRSKPGNTTSKNGAGSATGGKSVPNGAGSGPTSAPGSQAAGANMSGVNGPGAITIREGWFGPDGLPDVKVPQSTIDVGIEFLKEKIQDVAQPVDDKD